jgi:signal transduction histidine kinase
MLPRMDQTRAHEASGELPIERQTPDWVDRLVPTQMHEAGGETLRLARLCIYFGAALCFQAVFFTLFYIALGAVEVVQWVIVAVPALACTPAVLRRWRSIRVTGMYLCVITFAVLDAVAYYTGGLYSPAQWWTVIVPVIGLMLGGRQLALGSFVVVIAQAVALTFFTYFGEPRPALLDSSMNALLGGVGVGMLAVLVLSLAWLYEVVKDRMLATVEARNTQMRLVLDNVGQGFLTADADGRVRGHHSVVVEQWFGALSEGASLWTYLGAGNREFASWLELGWEALVDDVLPLELVIDQLPRELVTPAAHFRVEYRPLLAGGVLTRMVVVVTDVTMLVRIERSEHAQREFAQILDHALRDRAGLLQGIAETTRLVHRLADVGTHAMRIVHTIKGNSALFGMRGVVEHCHQLETALRESGAPITDAQIALLAAAWDATARPVLAVLDASAGVIELGRDEHDGLLASIRRGDSHGELAVQVDALAHERGARVLRRLGEQAVALAQRLGKGEIEIAMEPTALRFDPARYGGLWSAMVHAVRNAVDHGIETPDERELLGKRRSGRIELAAHLHHGEIVVEMRDDGRGVSWQVVAARATELGMPSATREELTRVLFSDGFSTRREVTEVSGRGIGLAALAAAADELGGHVELISAEGAGTTLRVILPAELAPMRIAATG